MANWGLLTRKAGAPPVPFLWLGSDDLDWTDDLERAEAVAAAIGEERVLVVARRVRARGADVWVREPVDVEYRGVKGEPPPCPGAASLAAWAIRQRDGPDVLAAAEVAKLVPLVATVEPF